MASIQTRSSVLAIKKEITEGTPVLPTVATDYVALQDTFAMEGGFALLDNAEMKSSIGMSKKNHWSRSTHRKFRSLLAS